MRRCFSRRDFVTSSRGRHSLLRCGTRVGWPHPDTRGGVQRRFMRGVTASFGVNLLCCGLHYFHAGAARPGGIWVVQLAWNYASPDRDDKMTETCPSTLWADAGGGSCTDTPRGESCWRSVGPHGECGFDAGGLPARFRKRPRAGALRSAGTLAAQRSVSARREGEASGGLPLDTTQVGMRGNAAGPV